MVSKSQRWSVDETVILIYFSSRHIRCKALRCLLARRGFHRSPRAIKHRAYILAKAHPELKVDVDFWDLDVVDNWIDNIAGNHSTVNELIRFGEKDAHDVINNQPIKSLEMVFEWFTFRLSSIRASSHESTQEENTAPKESDT